MTKPQQSRSSAPTATVLQSAFDDGLAARLAGRTANACPYDSTRERLHVHAWINGYSAGGDPVLEFGNE